MKIAIAVLNWILEACFTKISIPTGMNSGLGVWESFSNRRVRKLSFHPDRTGGVVKDRAIVDKGLVEAGRGQLCAESCLNWNRKDLRKTWRSDCGDSFMQDQ